MRTGMTDEQGDASYERNDRRFRARPLRGCCRAAYRWLRMLAAEEEGPRMTGLPATWAMPTRNNARRLGGGSLESLTLNRDVWNLERPDSRLCRSGTGVGCQAERERKTADELRGRRGDRDCVVDA